MTPGSPNPDGSVIVDSSPITLSWNASAGVDRYQLIVYHWDWAAGSWVYDRAVTTSANFMSYSPPVDNAHYAWSVQAGSGDRWSDWANWAFFYVNIPCTYTLSSPRARSSGPGDVGGVSVSAMPGCSWSAQSNVPWITVTSGSTGNGDGIVEYSVDAYHGRLPRTGTLTIAGQTFSVLQTHK